MEVLVAGMVMVVGLIFMAQFFTSAAGRILAADTRSLMHQIGTQQIEAIRAMRYEDVGTIGGWPAGALNAVDDDVLVEGRYFRVVREITYIEDASYAALNNGNGGPFPANYRRASVTVYLKNGAALSKSVGPVALTTDVAGGSQGGTLDMTVSDTAGQGIPGVQLTVTDKVLVPNVLINNLAIRTDNDGKLVLPGLTPDSGGGYTIRGDKPGYNSAELKQSVVVVSGTPFTVVQLIMDRLATMNIRVTDENGGALSGISLKVTGCTSLSPFTFIQTVTTNSSGNAVLADVRYSTTLEPYFVELSTPHSPALRLPTGVAVPEVDGQFLPLPAGKIPVLLDPGESQTVNLVVPSS